MSRDQKYKAIVIGASSGGMEIISMLVRSLPADFSLPILVVLHVADTSDGSWAGLLNDRVQITVKEADEKEQIREGTVYIAPANYHLLLEPDLTLTLTVDERVNYARPAVDVLFETAAESCKDQLIGIVCTGGNSDGALGLRYIKKKGGVTIVQDPDTADVVSMPLSAIKAADPDYILSPEEILDFLLTTHSNQRIYEFED
ncbi:chemotaxis protein CheB [Rhodohalobacter sp. 614A]|uniref:chemotaxis protein CheB n=1 Tax=Rhodohalobacter sp. 614A TaxID=2908649 RepID=UPI001F19ED8C|nr:chemotaxis protein CheB [Rhodohalobacter sp. 614A]